MTLMLLDVSKTLISENKEAVAKAIHELNMVNCGCYLVREFPMVGALEVRTPNEDITNLILDAVFGKVSDTNPRMSNKELFELSKV